MVVRGVILLNVFVYLAWNLSLLGDGEFMARHFLVSWESLSDGRLWTLWTSAFSHNMFFHLFLNMFALLGFGGVLERSLGRTAFIRFYLIAAAVSSLAHAVVSATLMGQPELPALGASGAVSGVILVFSLLFPREKILILGIIPLPAIVGALLFIGLDLWGLFEQSLGHGLPIGHGAHLGGAFTGIVYFLMLRRRHRLRRMI